MQYCNEFISETVSSFSIKYNATWHYTRDERDNRCWYSINPVYRVYRRGSSVCRWKPGMSRDDSPVKGFPLSNNIVLLHGNVPLLYFTAWALGLDCSGHCYKCEFSSVLIIKRQVAYPVAAAFVSFRAHSFILSGLSDLISLFQPVLSKIYIIFFFCWK